jgi:hypothetical protein
MATSSIPHFTLQGNKVPEEFHYTDMAIPVTILQGGTPVASAVAINSWSIDYIQDSVDLDYPLSPLTVTGGSGTLIFGGQHQGLFTNNRWHVRKNKETLDYDVKRVIKLLPTEYYAGYKFTADGTIFKYVYWTVTCTFMSNVEVPAPYPVSIPVTVTFSNIEQKVNNQWDRTKAKVRGYVAKGY